MAVAAGLHCSMAGGISPARQHVHVLGRLDEDAVAGEGPIDPERVAAALGQALETPGSPFSILSQAGGAGDIVNEIIKHIPVIIPDHATTLGEAIQMCPSGGTVLIRGGQHTVGARPGQEYEPGTADTAETQLTIKQDVSLVGAEGAMLRGMLILDSPGGSIRNLKVQDAGDCCLKVKSGDWQVESCFLLCGHASAVRAEGRSSVRVSSCKLGGEGKIGHAVAEYYDLPRTWIDTMGSVQEYGLRKNACYGVFVKDEATVTADGCHVCYCSESAVFVRDQGASSSTGCAFVSCEYTFTSGIGGGRSIVAEGCTVKGSKRLWYDDDRPSSSSVEHTSVSLAIPEPAV